MVNAAALLQQARPAPNCSTRGQCHPRRTCSIAAARVRLHSRTGSHTLFDFRQYRRQIATLQAAARQAGLTVLLNSNRRSKGDASGLCRAAQPSTAEEHARLGDEARAQSANRDTSDEFLQGETEQRRSPRARTAFNIVFVTSEASSGTSVSFTLAGNPASTAVSVVRTVPMQAVERTLHSECVCLLVLCALSHRCYNFGTCAGGALVQDWGSW